jgi:hypothetical protein
MTYHDELRGWLFDNRGHDRPGESFEWRQRWDRRWSTMHRRLGELDYRVWFELYQSGENVRGRTHREYVITRRAVQALERAAGVDRLIAFDRLARALGIPHDLHVPERMEP